MVDAISPRGYLTASQVADRLGVSVSRVNQLVQRGDLRSSRIGAITVIPESEVERRLGTPPVDGRRFTPPNAWGILAMASGEDAAWLAPDTRYRLRGLLERDGLSAMRPRLVDRGRPRGFRAHRSLLPRIRKDDDLMLTGATAAAELRLGLLAGEAIHAYVADYALSGIKRRYRLQESDSPNVYLRVIPWTDDRPPYRIAPEAAVALDLLEDEDPRAREVGKKLLQRLPR
jgi:excisionase family DNA binding protein